MSLRRNAAWGEAKRMMADPSIRLLVLDELNIALRYDYLPLAEVVAALVARRPGLHVVVTGRNAKPELIEAADCVTEFALVKHHFAAGVRAQEAIEVLTARALMFQGTGSDVGKSLIVAGSAAPSPGEVFASARLSRRTCRTTPR